MSSQSNKALVLAYYDRVVVQGQFAEIPNFIGADYVDHNAPAEAPRGPPVVASHLRAVRLTFPDLALHIHECVAEGSWVALRITGEATHLCQWRGIKPTGKRVVLRGLNMDRVAGGRIVEHWGEADTVGMLMQLGIDPFAGSTQSSIVV